MKESTKLACPELPENLAKIKLCTLNESSLMIMQKRYMLKDPQGKTCETPAQMWWRVAWAMAVEDAKYCQETTDTTKKITTTAIKFWRLLAEMRFSPGARVHYEAGNTVDGTGQLASCFVLPIKDDLISIFTTMQNGAIVQKNNGGTGYNFSHIRPKGDEVGGTPNVAAGPIHFIKTFSQAFAQILQGKKRGGGNMAILNVSHPDIIEFINLKSNDNSISNFNTSVGITNQFMNALKNDDDYDLINPRTGKSVGKKNAQKIFNLLVTKAWESADPGIFFLDKAQQDNPTPQLGIIECTNPCGEQPLRAYESCNLGSIVLSNHLRIQKEKSTVDWETLKRSIKEAIHFLDNMLDANTLPLKEIKKEVQATRKIGLGIVGWGTLLYKLEISYDSQQAIDLMQQITKFMRDEAIKESVKLAKTRGTFLGFKGSTWQKKNIKIRNAALLSFAPTGTMSMVVNTSGGIEPKFSLAYYNNAFYKSDGQGAQQSFLMTDQVFEEYAKQHKFYSTDLMQKIADNGGTVRGLVGVPKTAQKIFATAHDITPKWHIKMQAAAQEYVDAGISKTINMSNSATTEDIRQAYIMAWELGCKGITIYRDGSKQGQVLASKKTTKSLPLSEATTIVAMEDFKLSKNAQQFLERRYLKKDSRGQVKETVNQLWQRVADHIATAERFHKKSAVKHWAKQFYTVMERGEFFCGGALIYAGLGEHAVMSKCLVLPIADSISDIFSTLENNIQMLKRGVGTGFNFSEIRSTYATVKTTGEQAAGPIEYLKIFDKAQDSVRGRGGREMGSLAILNVSHPDIEKFVEMKGQSSGTDFVKEMSHYNISVGISDKFMKAVQNDEKWNLRDPHDKKIYKVISAKQLFEKIARSAWQTGDPGLFFLDTVEKANTTPELGVLRAANPCGEQPLLPYETCNLGNIDVSKFVQNTISTKSSQLLAEKSSEKMTSSNKQASFAFPFAYDVDFITLPLADRLKNYVKWEHLANVIKIGVRFLDNVIEINNYPLPEVKEATQKTRNIGLGIMGFADLLIKLGVSYASEDATKVASQLMEFVQTESHKASMELGKEKGSFSAFAKSTWKIKAKRKYMRNSRLTTIAPTGSVSILANCSPGIEPLFALGYRRQHSMGGNGHEQIVIDKLFQQISKIRGFYSDALMEKIADGIHLKDLAEEYHIPQDVIDIFVDAHEVAPSQHVQVQAAFQKHVDSAVSKTVNLSNNATWQDIAQIYQQAWQAKCKGITVFRDGSKVAALVKGSVAKKDDTSTLLKIEKYRIPRVRSDKTIGSTYKVNTGQGELFITINEDDLGMCEVFLILGKSGSFTAGYTEALGRLISTGLRSGINPQTIIKQLQGIRTSTPTLNKGMFVYSVPDAIAKIMKKHLKDVHNQKSLFTVEQERQLEVQAMQPVLVSQKKSSTVLTNKSSEISNTVQHLGKEYTKNNTHGDILECPDCGADLIYAEGCVLCRECGFSKCG